MAVDGRPVAARVYGELDRRLVVLLPDGQLALVDGRLFTDQPFQPATFKELRQALMDGPYRDFKVRQTSHYLIFYGGSKSFAIDSGRLLESLYQGLMKKFRDWGIDVQEAEFPMVAVIFETEKAFRAHEKVAPDIQAYYHILSNRIFFYETAEREQSSPEVAAIRKPQTIAHEGTHQILQNIGVQPRLAKWPLWLVEGLAEYCAPTFTKKGAEWAGIGKVNPLHMATINDLKDQTALQRVRGMPTARIGRLPSAADLVIKTDLSPTEYAYAWALTHHLATRRADDFLDFLKTMSRMQPLITQSPDDQLKSFRDAFGSDLGKVDRAVSKHLNSLKYDVLPFYAVVFEQPIPGGAVRKAALVSQSPSMIRQWLQTVESPRGAPSTWRALPFPTKTQALVSAEEWINNR